MEEEDERIETISPDEEDDDEDWYFELKDND